MTPDQVGARIRSAREAADMSQSELATTIGVKRGVIADMEAGKNVRSRSLFDAIHVLGLDEAGLIVASEPLARIDLVRAWLSAYDCEQTARVVLDSLAQEFLDAHQGTQPTPAPQSDAKESTGGNRGRGRIAQGRR